MRNHSYDLHLPTDSFHDNQSHFYMKGFTHSFWKRGTWIHSCMSCSQEPLILKVRSNECQAKCTRKMFCWFLILLFLVSIIAWSGGRKWSLPPELCVIFLTEVLSMDEQGIKCVALGVQKHYRKTRENVIFVIKKIRLVKNYFSWLVFT